MSDLYDVLGIVKSATETEIRAAYLRKARETHPDTGNEGASTEAFSQVQQAYEVLMDAESRAYYDEHGKIKDESEDAMLMVVINNAFGHAVMSGLELEHTDIKEVMLMYFQAKISELEQTIQQFKTQETRMRGMLDRFKFEDENPLENIVRTQEANIQASLAQLRQGLTLYQTAHEIFFRSDYRFEFKAPEPRRSKQDGPWTVWNISG